jgi:hypothetical protein
MIIKGGESFGIGGKRWAHLRLEGPGKPLLAARLTRQHRVQEAVKSSTLVHRSFEIVKPGTDPTPQADFRATPES